MSPIRLLLVDDNPDFIALADRFLSADPQIEIAGHALSGSEALEKIKRVGPDLVLLDLAMPGTNGLEITQRIKAQLNAPSVVILTLHDDPEYRAAAQSVGVDGFVAKSDFVTQLPPLIYQIAGRPSPSY